MISPVPTRNMSDYLSPAQIAEMLPSRIHGRRITPATVRRWQLVGLRNGRIFLPSRLVGTVRCSTLDDLQFFIDQLTELDETERHRLVDESALSPAKAKSVDDARLARFEKLAKERNL